jgi:uncharacterized protein (DUF1015 family)
MESRAVVAPPYVAGPLRLEPFRALTMNPSRVGDPASARAFARPYHDVASRLDAWERQGHLTHDAEPAVYVHEYTTAGLTVRGLVGALDISRRAHHPRERVVLPHEGVHPAQVSELADRMTRMGLNPAPILLVHRGPREVRELIRQVTALPAHQEFSDRAGQRNRLWALRAPETQARLADALAGSSVLLADGHHRYAAYLRMQEQAPGGPADRGLAMLVDQDDTPLFLGAIHRVLPGTAFDDVAAVSSAHGRFEPGDRAATVAALAPRTLVVTDGARWATLELQAAEGRAAVEVLHESLVPALPRGRARIGYHHSVEEALRKARPRSGSVAVLMPAPAVDLVQRIAEDDRLLPEKATSFQPKPSLGVLMRSLHDE